jgi:hypothetical protein
MVPAVNFLQGSYFMHIRAVCGETPNTVNPLVVRTRRYLTGREVEKLIENRSQARSLRASGRHHDPVEKLSYALR